MSAKIPHFETMEEPELNYIKVATCLAKPFLTNLTDLQMFNAGERITINNCSFGYLSHRIVFYLLNLDIKSKHTYFARVCPA